MPVLPLFALACQIAQLPPNPWKGMAPPPVGHERWEGRVVSYDSAGRLLVLDVESVWNDRGDEHFYSRPDRRELVLPSPVVLRWTDRSRRPATVGDLEEGRQVAAVVAGRASLRELLLAAPAAPTPSRSGVRALRAGAEGATIDADGVSSEVVAVAMVYPVLGGSSLADTFLASRGGGARRHHGQDLMAPKMTPLVAAFDGTVSLRTSPRHYWLTLTDDDGWRAVYMHVNNDTPGTDDGKGGLRNAFAPGVVEGARVRAGELLGWVGDSGNAEGTAPHLHFELHTPEGHVVNAVYSLEQAERLAAPVPRQAGSALVRKPGQTRLDGAVVRYDAVRDVLVVAMAAVEDESGARAVPFPALKYVKGASAAAGRKEFAVGAWAVAVGSDLGEGKAFEAAALEVAGP